MRSGEEWSKKGSGDCGDTGKETDDLGLNYGREDGEGRGRLERR